MTSSNMSLLRQKFCLSVIIFCHGPILDSIFFYNFIVGLKSLKVDQNIFSYNQSGAFCV